MALTNCRECQGQVSSEALACPHCGAPLRTMPFWRSFGFEWKSARTLFGYPLVHIAIGRNEQGKMRVAKGIIAIGQFGVGLITIAQFGIGLLFGFGQFILGFTALAQFAGAVAVGVGQFACGYVAVGQMVIGYYGLAQVGLGKFLWTAGKFGHKDPAAIQFFQSWWEAIKQLLK